MVDVNLLRAETIKAGKTDKDVAKNALHITYQAYNKKLHRKSKITTDDAEAICNYLKIQDLIIRAQIFLV